MKSVLIDNSEKELGYKHLKIREDTHRALTIVKAYLGCKSYDEAIKLLIKNYDSEILERVGDRVKNREKPRRKERITVFRLFR